LAARVAHDLAEELVSEPVAPPVNGR
jgi:hypothetical protein